MCMPFSVFSDLLLSVGFEYSTHMLLSVLIKYAQLNVHGSGQAEAASLFLATQSRNDHTEAILFAILFDQQLNCIFSYILQLKLSHFYCFIFYHELRFTVKVPTHLFPVARCQYTASSDSTYFLPAFHLVFLP